MWHESMGKVGCQVERRKEGSPRAMRELVGPRGDKVGVASVRKT